MDDIKQLEQELEISEQKIKPKQITANRGRLLRKIKKEISKIKENGVTAEEQKGLEELETLLATTYEDHKTQLGGRYKTEVVKSPNTVLGVLSVIPRGLGLSVRRIATCIGDLKTAKTNKEKIFKIIDLFKSAGLLAATPIIFTGKLIVKFWFLAILFIAYLIDLPSFLIKHVGENFIKGGSLIEDVKESVSNITFEDIKEIGSKAGEKIQNIPKAIGNGVEGIRKIYTFIDNNKEAIKKLFKFHEQNGNEINPDIKQIFNNLFAEKEPINLGDISTQQDLLTLFDEIDELTKTAGSNNLSMGLTN